MDTTGSVGDRQCSLSMDQPKQLIESNVKKFSGLCVCAMKIQYLDVREQTLVQDHWKMPCKGEPTRKLEQRGGLYFLITCHYLH
jgi:hypothetical protein